ncbi:MAG: GNAT family N-acetyltransferase [Eubacterium sp.]
MDIRYLQNEEKQKSRELYECCFPEDSRQFVDYYYKEKCWDNAIWVAEEQGRIVSMIHENPFRFPCADIRFRYTMWWLWRLCRNTGGRVGCGLCWSGCFGMRHAGGNPFPFSCLPIRRIMNPLGIGIGTVRLSGRWRGHDGSHERNLHELEFWRQRDALPCPDPGRSSLQPLSTVYWTGILTFMSQETARITKCLRLERQSEQGDVIVMRDEDGTCVGCFCFDREDGFSIREPILRQNAEERKHALMMGRIVNLEQFVKSLHFPEPFEETICITDDIIPENNGCFRFQREKGQSTAARAETMILPGPMDIAEFGQFLFDRLRIFVNEIV